MDNKKQISRKQVRSQPVTDKKAKGRSGGRKGTRALKSEDPGNTGTDSTTKAGFGRKITPSRNR